MLAALANIPRSDAEWAIWSYAHRDQHLLIRQAIQVQYNVALIEYPLDPIPLQSLNQWLDWNQISHNDFNGVLGTPSNDLQEADFNDPAQLQAWIYLHLREHEVAASALQI